MLELQEKNTRSAMLVPLKGAVNYVTAVHNSMRQLAGYYGAKLNVRVSGDKIFIATLQMEYTIEIPCIGPGRKAFQQAANCSDEWLCPSLAFPIKKIWA